MARTTKAKTETPAIATAPTTTEAPVKASKSGKKTKSVAATENVSVVVDTVVVAASATEDAPVVESDTMIEQSVEFLAKLQQISVLLSSLKTEYRTLEKKWSKELKLAQKSSSKRKRKAGNRAPSGFVKPALISNELAGFLEKPIGSEMARTDVTRDINKYIRANNLQDKDNGRKINPDVKLATLLKLTATDELTYFNLQRYMSPHFTKTGAVTANVKVEALAV